LGGVGWEGKGEERKGGKERRREGERHPVKASETNE